MRTLLLVGAIVAAPVLFASSGAFACCDCDEYGYSYGYSAPGVYGYSSYYGPADGYRYGSYYRPAYGYSSYYGPGVRFYGARTNG